MSDTGCIIFLGTIHAIRFDSEGAAKVTVEVPASEGHKVAVLTQVTKIVLTFTVEQEDQHDSREAQTTSLR